MQNVLKRTALAAVAVVISVPGADAAVIIDTPYLGVTHITRTETLPRPVSMHIVTVDLDAPGIGFSVTAQGGTRETVRQTTLGYLNQQQAQVAVNAHFFLPFPSNDADAFLVGFGASAGNVYSAFENPPVQSFAIASNSPALNIDQSNNASIVTRDSAFADGFHVNENVSLFNAVSGSAQVITNGTVSIPQYIDATHPDALLTPNATYSNSNSWYNLARARTLMGLSQDARTLVIFTVDQAAGSQGMSVGEAASILRNDYGVWNALNLDGGGSTSLAIRNPTTGVGALVNNSADNPLGRAVASNFAIFARPVPVPAMGVWIGGVAVLAGRRRRA
jgi:exopolysaccharide biosynthesis protein